MHLERRDKIPARSPGEIMIVLPIAWPYSTVCPLYPCESVLIRGGLPGKSLPASSGWRVLSAKLQEERLVTGLGGHCFRPLGTKTNAQHIPVDRIDARKPSGLPFLLEDVDLLGFGRSIQVEKTLFGLRLSLFRPDGIAQGQQERFLPRLACQLP